MNSDRETPILEQVRSFYGARFAEHGATAKGVDWKDEASHNLRHRQFLRLLEDHPQAFVLDLGCGFGDFFRFLRQNGFAGRYIGYDLVPSMIEHAIRAYGQSADVQWRVGASPEEAADFAFASGIFNVKQTTSDTAWKAYVLSTIDVLARSSRMGFGFNVLSLSSDPERRRPDLYYADPVETLSYCLGRFGRSVALLQDYGLYEFTVLMRKP